MIRESCSCGASIEVDYKYESNERRDVEEWRRTHRCQTKSAYIPPWTQRYNSGTYKGFTLNEDFAVGTNGEPVWIGEGPLPEYWDQWATAYTKCNQPVDNS